MTGDGEHAEPAADVFISYKREDQARAHALATALAEAGWQVWWDPALRAGEHFDNVIGEALAQCRCVIVLWSRLSVASQYVLDEAAFALRHDKLVPVRLDATEPPFRYQGLHTLDFSAWNGEGTAAEFRALRRDIEALIGPPGAPKPPPPPAGGGAAATPSARRRVVLAAAVVVVIALVASAAVLRWRAVPDDGDGDGAAAAECVLRFAVSPRSDAGPVPARPLALVVAAGDDERRVGLQPGGTAIDGSSDATLSVDRGRLEAWTVTVLWSDGAESSFQPLAGCRPWTGDSADGLARLVISPL